MVNEKIQKNYKPMTLGNSQNVNSLPLKQITKRNEINVDYL